MKNLTDLLAAVLLTVGIVCIVFDHCEHYHKLRKKTAILYTEGKLVKRAKI